MSVSSENMFTAPCCQQLKFSAWWVLKHFVCGGSKEQCLINKSNMEDLFFLIVVLFGFTTGNKSGWRNDKSWVKTFFTLLRISGGLHFKPWPTWNCLTVSVKNMRSYRRTLKVQECPRKINWPQPETAKDHVDTGRQPGRLKQEQDHCLHKLVIVQILGLSPSM